MNETAEFDLDAAINEWRHRLSQSPALRADSLDELESHLRDSVSNLQLKGLSAEEGFWIASRRMGGTSALTTEFAKVHRRELWRERLFWMLAGVLGWNLVLLLSRVVADSAVIGGLAGVGYEFGSSSPQAFGPKAWLVASLLVLTQLLIMVILLGAVALLLARTRILAAVAGLMRHPISLGLAVIPCLIFLAVHALSVLRTILFARILAPKEAGVISASTNISSMLLTIFLTLLCSTLFVWLARRRVQLRGGG